VVFRAVKVMVRKAEIRSRKYEESINPDVIGGHYRDQKGDMVEQQKAYFGEIKMIEEKAKKIVEEAGVPVHEVAQYINVARKCYSLAKKFTGPTLQNEAQLVVNHWASRGLNGLLLARVCNISGCGAAAGVPSDVPAAGNVGDLLVYGLDGWETLSPGDACKVLHSRGAGLIPDWVDHGGLGGLLDDDHTQYVLRSILTTHGDLFYRNGADIARLPAGVSGEYLKTQGPGAAPIWAAPPGGDPRVPRTLFAHAHEDGSSAFPPILPNENTGEVFILLPDNWNGTDKLVLWFLGGFGMSSTVSVTIDVGTCDEGYSNHSQTVNGINMTVVQDEYECLDITAAFATVIGNFNSRDMIWIKVTPTIDFNVYLIGAEIQET
jgi:hypothetical protein